MVAEIVAAMASVPAGWVVDATAGGGGHSEAILKARPDLRVLAVDQDPAAVHAASTRLAQHGERFMAVHGRFSTLSTLCERHQTGPLAGLLADLGVSSHQLDEIGRAHV